MGRMVGRTGMKVGRTGSTGRMGRTGMKVGKTGRTGRTVGKMVGKTETE